MRIIILSSKAKMIGDDKETKMNIINAQLNYWDVSLDFKREVSCFATPEHGVISISTNNRSGRVNLDWDKIWGFLSSQPKCDHAIIIHTHPFDCPEMSTIDDNMIRGWRLALGIPIKFLIVSQDADKSSSWIAYYTCDKGVDKKIFVSLDQIDSVKQSYPDLEIVSHILYGMSKANVIHDGDMTQIEELLKTSDLRFI